MTIARDYTQPGGPLRVIPSMTSLMKGPTEKPPEKSGYRVIWDCIERRWGYTRNSNLAPGEDGYTDQDRVRSTLVGPLSKPLKDDDIKSLYRARNRIKKRMDQERAAVAKIGPRERFSRTLHRVVDVEDRFHIAGRGEGVSTHQPDPVYVRNEVVIVDGVARRIIGIEQFSTLGQDQPGKTCGLLLGDI